MQAHCAYTPAPLLGRARRSTAASEIAPCAAASGRRRMMAVSWRLSPYRTQDNGHVSIQQPAARVATKKNRTTLPQVAAGLCQLAAWQPCFTVVVLSSTRTQHRLPRLLRCGPVSRPALPTVRFCFFRVTGGDDVPGTGSPLEWRLFWASLATSRIPTRVLASTVRMASLLGLLITSLLLLSRLLTLILARNRNPHHRLRIRASQRHTAF